MSIPDLRQPSTSPADADNTPSIAPFHLEEYKSLRSEIASDDADVRRLERLCSTGCAAVWVWLFATNHQAWPGLAFLPIVIALFGWIRVAALYNGMLRISEYLRQIEKQYAIPPLVGWETHLHDRRRALPWPRSTMMRSAHAFWLFLVATTITLATTYTLLPR